MRKVLKDYPVNLWLQAADDCTGCRAPVEIILLDREEPARAMTRVHHQIGCSTIELRRVLDSDVSILKKIISVGWEYPESLSTLDFRGVNFPIIRTHDEAVPCLICWRIVTSGPIVYFIPQHLGGGLLTFCKFCVEKHNLLENQIKR